MSKILTCEHLTKKYNGEKLALDHVDLTLDFGRIVGLLGPNGSGKTTLIKLANGLLQPTEGIIKIAGMAPGPETKALVSYLPDADWLPDWMKVEELVGMFRDFYADFDAARAKEMLARLASVILCIYTACMIAHQFKNHMLAVGILGFIGLNFVKNQIDQLLGIDSVNMFVDVSCQVVGIHVDRGWSIAQRLAAFGPNVYYLSCFVFTTAIAAAYFFLTRWLMKNKLNLE